MQTMYELLGIHKKVDKEKQNVENSKNNNQSVLKGRFKIQKSEDDKHLAFGWASISIDEAGEQLVDWQEDMIDPEELENAAYDFVRLYREGGEMHERGDCAILVESVVFTEEKMEAMGNDKKRAMFYQSIIETFHRMGYSIVSEGVETEEEMSLLSSWGVDMIQGYYFSRPLPVEELLKLLSM